MDFLGKKVRIINCEYKKDVAGVVIDQAKHNNDAWIVRLDKD